MKKIGTDLKQKTILITGASSGIGRECARMLSQYGANVILVARNEARLQETSHQLDQEGRHLWFSQDVTAYDALEERVKSAVQQLGKISGYIHSAGLEMTLPLRNMKPSLYEDLFAVNVIAGFELAKILSKKKYVSEQGASFVFISSVMGKLGQVGKTAYCSSKGALLAGCQAMALELAPKHIRVNCLLPGVVRTEMSEQMFEHLSEDSKNAILEMHPLGLGTPEDVAHACLFLLSDASRWMTGSHLVVDGGYSLA